MWPGAAHYHKYLLSVMTSGNYPLFHICHACRDMNMLDGMAWRGNHHASRSCWRAPHIYAHDNLGTKRQVSALRKFIKFQFACRNVYPVAAKYRRRIHSITPFTCVFVSSEPLRTRTSSTGFWSPFVLKWWSLSPSYFLCYTYFFRNYSFK